MQHFKHNYSSLSACAKNLHTISSLQNIKAYSKYK